MTLPGPSRTIVVEPVELPVADPLPVVDPLPEPEPEREPPPSQPTEEPAPA